MNLIGHPIRAALNEITVVDGQAVRARDICPRVNGQLVRGVTKLEVRDHPSGQRTLEMHLRPQVANPDIEEARAGLLAEVTFADGQGDPIAVASLIAGTRVDAEQEGLKVWTITGRASDHDYPA